MAFQPGKIWPGANLRINVTISDGFDTPADPSTVTFKTCDPCGAVTSYVYPTTVQREAIGKYYIDIAPEEAGRWRYRWQTTGTGLPYAAEGNFIVQSSAFFDDSFGDYA